MTCNLTPNAAWSLTDDDLALEIEPGDIPGDGNEDEDDVAGSQSMKEEEKRASCRTKITPGTYESETDSESLTKIRLANDSSKMMHLQKCLQSVMMPTRSGY